MEIEFVSQGAVEGEAASVIAVPVFDGQVLSAAAEALDAIASGIVSRALAVKHRNGDDRSGFALNRALGDELDFHALS